MFKEIKEKCGTHCQEQTLTLTRRNAVFFNEDYISRICYLNDVGTRQRFSLRIDWIIVFHHSARINKKRDGELAKRYVTRTREQTESVFFYTNAA